MKLMIKRWVGWLVLGILVLPAGAHALDPALAHFGDPNHAGYELVTVSDKLPFGNGAGGSFKLPGIYKQPPNQSLELKVLPAGLELYYPLNSVSEGAIYDETINQSRADVSGSPQLTAGKLGQALALNGQKDYVEATQTPQLESLKRISWSAWIYPTDANRLSQDQMILSKQGTNYLRLFGRKLFGSFNIGGQERSVSGTTALDNNNWYHVAATYDGTKITLYLNGNVEAELPSLNGDIKFNTGPLELGRWQASDPRYFAGRLDEVKIYSRALSAEEIKREYVANSEVVSSAQPLFSVAPGPLQTASLQLNVISDAPAISLLLAQDHNLRTADGSTVVPQISGTIANPQLWQEGTTVGFGFNLDGSRTAAVPNQLTNFYSSGGRSSILNYLLHVENSQPAGSYSNQITYRAVFKP